MGYSFRLTARVLLYAPSHRQDSTYHGLCYTSRGALAGTRNSSMGPPHEGSIRRPIAPWANALTMELHWPNKVLVENIYIWFVLTFTVYNHLHNHNTSLTDDIFLTNNRILWHTTNQKEIMAIRITEEWHIMSLVTASSILIISIFTWKQF